MEDHKFIDSKFRLVILASKRAKQLVKGAKKKINMHAENPLTIALKEIENGLINFEIIDDANDRLALENLEALGNDKDETEEEDLLSYADDDDDEDYLEESEGEEETAEEEVYEEDDLDSDDSDEVVEYDDED